MTDVFTKQPREPRSAEAEAAGLRWLREASNCVAEVVGLDAERNVLQTRRVHEVSPSQDAARQAGRELARIHAGADAFGPRRRAGRPNYIGTQEQDPRTRTGVSSTSTTGPAFARRRGGRNLDAEGWAGGAGVRPVVGTRCIVAPPIHGDLWAGNLLFRRGPCSSTRLPRRHP